MRDQESDLAANFAVGLGREILVVDDSPINLIAIEAALEALERPLVTATSGTEALRYMLERDFALILLDVAMPGMDGFETAQVMRSRERNRATPIIFLTGVASEQASMLRGYDLGAFDYLMKPVQPEVLRAKVRVFVELQERTIELHAAQALVHQRELEAQRHALATRALELQMRQLITLDRQKDHFLAILSHELRNPMQPMLTAIEMIDSMPDVPVSERTRQVLHRHIYHMSRMVDDLLDVARLTSDKLELRRERIAIDDAVDHAIAQCRRAIDDRTQTLIVRRAGSAAVVDADLVRLTQVICNLLTNASRFTPDGGAIEIVASVDAGNVIVTVADTGRGIAPDVLPKIFDMFVQERVAGDGSGGLGLGLGLVKRLVELHGGAVVARSEGRERGSTFEIRLPLAIGQPIGSAPGHPPAAAQRRLRVLVCDDEPDVPQLVADMLRSYGHEVTTVTDGRAAVNAVVSDRPDVALIDLDLHGISGYEVARIIRRELHDGAPRLVAMTGYGTASARAAARDAGFDAHVTKPATAEQILAALHKEGSGAVLS